MVQTHYDDIIAELISRFDLKAIKLVLADSDRPSIGSNAIVRHIKSATIHENFHAYTFNNDIAIIEMDYPVPVDGVVRTACLPEDSKLSRHVNELSILSRDLTPGSHRLIGSSCPL